jgi:hypothetical protein
MCTRYKKQLKFLEKASLLQCGLLIRHPIGLTIILCFEALQDDENNGFTDHNKSHLFSNNGQYKHFEVLHEGVRSCTASSRNGLIMNQSFIYGREENRIELLKALPPIRVSYNGLPGYKQVMMHKNYLPFIPEQYRCDQLYCKPPKEVLDAERKDQKERIQYKKMKKVAKLEVMTQ